MNKFMLNITASSGEYYQGDCEDLVLPISDGVYGIQAGHSPVLVAIHMGILHFEVNGESQDILVGDGIAEVTPAYVMVLVDSAERPEDIDKNRAEAARIRAEERLQHQQSMHEYYQSKIALDRAVLLHSASSRSVSRERYRSSAPSSPMSPVVSSKFSFSSTPSVACQSASRLGSAAHSACPSHR